MSPPEKIQELEHLASIASILVDGLLPQSLHHIVLVVSPRGVCMASDMHTQAVHMVMVEFMERLEIQLAEAKPRVPH
jgi:hypothetical protein